MLEFGRYGGFETGERTGPGLGERALVLAHRLVAAVRRVQPHRQFENEGVDPRGVAVELVRAYRELDEVAELAGRRPEVEVHAAGRVRRHVQVRLVGDRMR